MARDSTRFAVGGLPTSDPSTQPASAFVPSTHPLPPDLFLLCRPPPSSSHHALDVHVQLVQPGDPASRRTAGGSRRSSLSESTRPDTPGSATGRSFSAVADASVGRVGPPSGADEDDGRESEVRGRGRSRSPSVSSTRSGTSRDSAYADSMSASGRSDSGGGGGGSGGKRRVVPLLALEYHSILPTVVNDSGTGQRVARFHKRGIELNGLTMLDPVYLASPNAELSPPSSSILAVPNPNLAKADSGFFSRFKRRSVNESTSPPSKLTSASYTSNAHDSPAPLHLLSLVRTPSPTPAPESHRSAGYAFLLRKWLRSDLAEAPRSVRIEWTRSPVRRRMRQTQSGGVDGLSSAPQSRRGSEQSHASAGGLTATSEPGAQSEEDPEEEEEERAWLCTLVYPLLGAAASSTRAPTTGASTNDPEGQSHVPSPPPGGSPSPFPSMSTPATSPAPVTRRLLLATLRPAPHHPKLVSTLLLPPSLPSIPLGAYHPSRGLLGGALSPEDLRDLAMVTALWVAVRERLGGLEGVAAGEGAGAGGALGLVASRSAGPGGTPADSEGRVTGTAAGGGGVAALTEKAGLAIQGLVAPGSAGAKRAPGKGGSGFVGRLFGSR